MTQRLLGVEFIAVDNNVTAVEVCRENFKRHAVSGEVMLDDCAAGIDRKVDVVICNPPFHQGFDIDDDLTTRFLEAAKKLLHKDGAAFFVVNSFIPLERKAKRLFSKVSVLDNNKSFKLLILEP
jgi:16S rRNA (guanine1207-N2)-methyltransferase